MRILIRAPKQRSIFQLRRNDLGGDFGSSSAAFAWTLCGPLLLQYQFDVLRHPAVAVLPVAELLATVVVAVLRISSAA
jgi:hypothetical protein